MKMNKVSRCAHLHHVDFLTRNTNYLYTPKEDIPTIQEIFTKTSTIKGF